jgi:hypothetical protein
VNAPLNTQPPGAAHRRGTLGGVMLILIGMLALLWQWAPAAWWALWFLPLLGVLFLAWGLLSREVGLLVPGGILVGIGAGVLFMQAYQSAVGDMAAAGTFLLIFAAGWVMITLAALIIHKTVWWPLVVAAVLAVVGAGLIIGGPALTVLEALGKLWPLVLVGLGAWMLIRRSGWRPS